MNRFAAQYPLVVFFVLAFVLGWLGVPLAAVSPILMALVASAAPSLAALMVSAFTGGRAAVGVWWSRMGIWRVGWGWHLMALGIPVIVSAAILGIATLGGGSDLLSGGAFTRSMLPALALLPVVFLFAAGEELGWRGFALPHMLAKNVQRPMFVAVILGIVHAIYHLPLWVSPEWPTPGYSFLSFLVSSLAFGIVWTWLALNTRGSVIIATWFHGMINLAGNLFFAGMAQEWLSWLMPIGYGLAALFVVWVLPGPGSNITNNP